MRAASRRSAGMFPPIAIASTRLATCRSSASICASRCARGLRAAPSPLARRAIASDHRRRQDLAELLEHRAVDVLHRHLHGSGRRIASVVVGRARVGALRRPPARAWLRMWNAAAAPGAPGVARQQIDPPRAAPDVRVCPRGVDPRMRGLPERLRDDAQVRRRRRRSAPPPALGELPLAPAVTLPRLVPDQLARDTADGTAPHGRSRKPRRAGGPAVTAAPDALRRSSASRCRPG